MIPRPCQIHRLIVSASLILGMIGGSGALPAASASVPPDEGGERRAYHPHTGRLSFLGVDPANPIRLGGASMQALDANGRAMFALDRYGADFGVPAPRQDLKPIRTNEGAEGRQSVRFEQRYQGIPLIGGELVVNLDASGGILSINGEISPDLSLPTQPKVTAEEAMAMATEAIAKFYHVEPGGLSAGEPRLMVYDSRLLGRGDRAPELVWQLEVTGDLAEAIREYALVNAERGGVSLHFSLVDTSWSYQSLRGSRGRTKVDSEQAIPAAQSGGIIRTYTAGNTWTLPGTLLCTEAQPACTGGANLHADAAHRHARNTYDFYLNRHERDSIDGAGMTVVSTVNFGQGYANAFWDGSQMVYGDAYGFPLADDVVGHELTHGVTDYESRLFYYYQSGAINESFSDLWGEFVDLTNGTGTDSPSSRWLLGEDISGYGALRNMADPTDFGDPDRMTSPYYYLDEGDNGGVHYNSGVNNKAVYLMTDGGSFNGYSITGIGIDKAAAVYYEAQINLLTPASDYYDLYEALFQACLNVIGGDEGVIYPDCLQVRNATLAVEMNEEPIMGFNPDVELCSSSTAPVELFYDGLESGVGQWTFGAVSGSSAWDGWAVYPGTGDSHLWGDDYYESSDSYAAMAVDVPLPMGSQPYLHFKHAFALEDPDYDGAWPEYSTDGGANWYDADVLPSAGQDYTGTINPDWGNPNAGKEAFVGDSHGYVSSRYDLSALAGQNVRFRFRLSTDIGGYDLGWFVDDVRIYTCTAEPTFIDVPFDHWAHDYIEALYQAGYTAGCSADPLMYCPEQTMNRAESAVFVEHGIHGIPYLPDQPTEQVFADLPLESWGAKWATALWYDGYTAGCGTNPLIYCPWQGHTRAEGCVFFLHMLNGPGYLPSQPTVQTFADVPLATWYAKWVQAAYDAGLLDPCEMSPVLRFCPNDPLTRAMAAYMMVRAKDLPLP